MSFPVGAAGAAVLMLGAPVSGLVPSPAPGNPAGVLATPLPLPSVPTILPGASPSPSPAPAPAGSGSGSGSKTGLGSSTGSGATGFGSGGIASAFAPTNVSAASNTAQAPPAPPATAYKPVAPPATVFNPSDLWPVDHGAAAPSAVLPLLAGLLLLSLGLMLTALRHRRAALVAASLERTKTDFLNLASHELRGPLTVLKGYISTAKEGEYGELPREFAGRLPVVQSQLSRMEMLVEQMLETARLEAGNPEVRREPTDLRRLVQNALPTEILEGTDHQVDVEAPDQPVISDIDERRVEQVLHNLIDNALKYSDPPAHVTVRLTADARTARIDVSDRGHGIEARDMDKLFNRFGRLVTEENSHIPGVGLGLFLGRAVAQMHGGDLTAVSTPGEGSIFTLTLPLHAQTGPLAATPASLGQRAVRWFGRLLPSKAPESVS